MKLPAGTTTILGQCGQSRKTVSGGVWAAAGAAMDWPARHAARASAAAGGASVVTAGGREQPVDSVARRLTAVGARAVLFTDCENTPARGSDRRGHTLDDRFHRVRSFP